MVFTQVLELTRLSINRTFFLARNAFSPQKRNNIAEGNLLSHFGRKKHLLNSLNLNIK